ncbi:MAG TPA: FAD-binding oxidoreductase [Capillimicrobium sp.]|nr:FAD-binding oxidoreductase [Capillimicrobium sp.]
MTLLSHDATALGDRIAGDVSVPGDARWDAARQAFNLTIDQRPTAIVIPRDARDVAQAVDFARERGLRIAAQATGHNAGPLGSLDDTLLVRTSRLGGVSVDAAARRVRVGAGVTWAGVTPALSDVRLAALHGSSPGVGIVGYSLGGGMGWLARKHGLQANAVTAIELVTADGRVLRVDAEREPELFWALRGGGGGFGVVTAMEFRVVPVAELYAGAMFFEPAAAADVLHAWNELLPALPDELTSWATILQFPPAPEVPEALRGRSFAVVLGAFLGSEADGRALLAPVRELGPAIDTFAMQPPIALAELAMDPPDPLPYLGAHRLTGALPAAAIDELVAVAGPASGSPLAMVQLRHLGGALARRAPDAGARATLPGEISMFAVGAAGDPSSTAAVAETLQAVDAALAPHAAGLYSNFVEVAADASAFFDAETWSRLRSVKRRYDPADLFRANHHVPAAP